jgi:hypothetical protein
MPRETNSAELRQHRPQASPTTVSLILSMLFVVYSGNTEATGFAVYEPFV